MAVLGLATAGALGGGLIFDSAFAAQSGFVLGQVAARALGIGVEKDKRSGSEEAAEFRVTNSSFGAPLPSVDGAFPVAGQPIWIGEIIAVETEESVGKGFGGPTVAKTEYFGTWAVALADCRDLLPNGYAGIIKLWVGPDRELVLDKSAGAGPNQSDRLRRAIDGGGALRIYTGQATQQPDPTIQSFEGVDNTPAYRGTCYVVFERFPLRGPAIEPVSAIVTVGTTPKRPYHRLDPKPDSIHPTFYKYFGDGRRIVDANGTIVDMAAQQKLRDGSWAVANFDLGPVDRFNRSWGKTGISTNVIIYVMDAETGAEIASQPVNNLNGGWQGTLLPDGSFVAYSGAGTIAQMRISGTEVEILRDQFSPVPLRQDPTVDTWSGGGGFAPHFLALDGEGTIWLTMTGTVRAWLIECDGTDGTPLVYHDMGGAGAVTPFWLCYEPASDSLIVSNLTELWKFDLATRSIVDTLPISLFEGRLEGAFRYGPVDGKLYLQTNQNGDFTVVDVASTPMVEIETLSPNAWLGTAFEWESYLYDPINNALICVQTTGDVGSEDWAWLYLDRFDAAAPTLQSVVERRGAEVGLSASDDLDAANLTDAFPGGVRGQRAAMRPYLESTQPFYLYDAVEESRIDGYKIRFPKRGAATVADIPASDLEARSPGQAIARQPRLGRTDPRTLPRVLGAKYRDPAIDYQPGYQSDQREIGVVVGNEERTLDASHLVLDNDRAAQAVEVNLFLAHLNATPVWFTTTRKYEKISAGDRVRVLGDTATWTVLVRAVRLTEDNVKAFEAVVDDAPVYSSARTGAAAEGVPASQVSILSPTSFAVLDVPLLPGEADELRLFFPGGPSSPAGEWPGAVVLRSTENVAFAPYAVISAGSAIGFATEALGDGDPAVFDRGGVLKVRLLDGTPSSITEAALLGDMTLNGFALKSGAGWELGNFVDATLQSDGSWHLSTLVRGSFNTENYMAGHAAGDTVVLLTAAGLAARKTITVSEIAAARYYRAVTAGGLARDAVTKTHAAAGRSKLPYAPQPTKWALASGDYTATAVRRSRVFNLPTHFGSVPLGESVEDFEADLLDDAAAVALTIRQTPSAAGSKITLTSTGFTTLVKAADLSGIAVPFVLKLYQIGGVDGATRGEAATAIIG